jgi:hypothetical protein
LNETVVDTVCREHNFEINERPTIENLALAASRHTGYRLPFDKGVLFGFIGKRIFKIG